MIRNRGISYDFVLNKLPFAQEEIFVDASSSWGIGGFHGDSYFAYSNRDLEIIYNMFRECRTKSDIQPLPHGLPIAYRELLAAMIGIVLFVPACGGCIIRLNSDNANAVSWLQKSRCSAGIGFRMLAVIELYKHMHGVKITTHHIKGVANGSADLLSRGEVPRWLREFGKKIEVDLTHIVDLLTNPLNAWKTIS